MSRLVAPDRSTIARDRDASSPITRAVTGLLCLPIGREEGRPHVRLMQETNASSMKSSTSTRCRAGRTREG